MQKFALCWLGIIIIIVVAACQSDQDKKIQVLKNDIQVLHDEVMPKMAEIADLEGKVKAQLDNLIADSLSDENAALECQEILADLKKADEGMMQWMGAYQMELNGTPEEQIDYLQEEKAKIEMVKNDILSAIERGHYALQANQEGA